MCFCCLLFSFGGCQENQDIHPPLKIIEKLPTVEFSKPHPQTLVSEPLYTLTNYREAQRAFIYTGYNSWYLLY